MPSDREFAEAFAHDWLMRGDPGRPICIAEIVAALAQARAEGFRDGIERAAQWLESRGWMGFVAAIRALAPVPDSEIVDGWEPRDPRPWLRDIMDGAVESIARQIEAGPTGAKATDPRGSREPGGEDATEEGHTDLRIRDFYGSDPHCGNPGDDAANELLWLRAKVRAWHDLLATSGSHGPIYLDAMLAEMASAAVPVGPITEADIAWAHEQMAAPVEPERSGGEGK